ncbi:hypothetical protein [Pseudomonas cannabina]|uniref:hypothetical protein n=1 Tax=Pseudomonas cannabina TaxID=86840 RepID=UPI00088A3CED|nr:hypothetical protein [Pseudomonas cannabina]SDR54017.1 hypothetical protein SAMN05216597_5615 [Pseudomonas cannabina]
MNITPNYITAQEWQSLFEKKDPAVLVPMTKLSIEPEPAKQRDPNAEFYRKEETLGLPDTRNRKTAAPR